jgi:ATP-dependent DNA helicase RecG
MTALSDSVQYLKGVGPQRAALLDKLGVRTVADLLRLFPRKYLDRSKMKKMCRLIVGEEATVQGNIMSVKSRRSRFGKSILTVMVGDDTGFVNATYFNQNYLSKVFKKGMDVILHGKVGFYNGMQLVAPEFEIIPDDGFDPIHTRGIIPVYPLTDGLYQKWLRRLISEALDAFADQVQDVIPADMLARNGLTTVHDAIRAVHFPETFAAAAPARKRFIYEEFFTFETQMALRRRQARVEHTEFALKMWPRLDQHIRARFPFKLTKAQERVISQISADLQSDRPMNRLLQGDVGSGKTVVALYAMLTAVGNKCQAAIMAPTEILAEQHDLTMRRLLAGSKVTIVTLSGGMTAKERRDALERIGSGEADIVIGTHALIEEDVKFAKLAVAIIDEQHKFGVLQRADFRRKGLNPHVLVMTATPIPRTLALTVFGDLDVSILDEMPPGRKAILTILRDSKHLATAFDFIRQRLKEGRQAYFVYPLIDDSDKVALKSAKMMSKQLAADAFKGFTVELLHGKMKPDEKDEVMERFREGRTHILVSTVVIEVGIDVPNATVMVIDHADRYGLATLHQLRGRIGRGEYQSHCLLFGDAKTDDAKMRLSVMTRTCDGFKVAEEDLRIRGPGEFLGTSRTSTSCKSHEGTHSSSSRKIRIFQRRAMRR